MTNLRGDESNVTNNDHDEYTCDESPWNLLALSVSEKLVKVIPCYSDVIWSHGKRVKVKKNILNGLTTVRLL